MNEAAQAPVEQVDVTIAVQVALMARRETFLAYYPRKLKLAITALIALFLIVGVVSLFAGGSKDPAAPLTETQAEPSEEELAAIPTSMDQRPDIERRMPQSEEELYAAAANDSKGEAMSIAPDMGLVEETKIGLLPIVGEDARRPWQVYAKAFDFRDPRPRIALVIGDLGLSRVATDAALHRLPAAVTLAFDVQGAALNDWLARARQEGHETILSIPMEPFDYPRNDPGPNSLLTTLPNSDNIERLRQALVLAQGYVGLTTLSGSRFVADPAKVTPVLEEVRKRGLLFLDARISPHSVISSLASKMKVPVAASIRTVDVQPTPQAIDAALAQLEQTARVEGAVVAMASPLPVTIDRIELWAKSLAQRGIVLAPLSAVVR